MRDTYESKVLAIVQDWLDAEDGLALLRQMDAELKLKSEEELMDADLEKIRLGIVPVVRLTPEQMWELENERWGE